MVGVLFAAVVTQLFTEPLDGHRLCSPLEPLTGACGGRCVKQYAQQLLYLSKGGPMGLRARWGLAAAVATAGLVLGVVAPEASALPNLPPPPNLPALSLGDDAFYKPPATALVGQPGDVIRSREVLSPLSPLASVRQLMYQSTNAAGQTIPVTGALLVPLEPATGPRPLVLVNPATRGVADHCAPSRDLGLTTLDLRAPELDIMTILNFVGRGFAVVLTDYEGVGTPLPATYLVGRPAGYAGLDALRAALRLNPNDGLSEKSPLGISGYSQGGQAVAWTAELQATYAPELNVKGVILGGVPYDMNAQVGHFEGSPIASVLSVLSYLGADTAYPEFGLSELLKPGSRGLIDRIKNSCSLELAAAFPTINLADVTLPGTLEKPEVQAAFAESQLGTVAPTVPAYIYYGSIDELVPPHFNRDLYRDWCQRGASVKIEQLPMVDHFAGQFVGGVGGFHWLAQRLGGEPAEPGCSETGVFTS